MRDMIANARQGETQPTVPRTEIQRGLKGALPMMLSFVPFGLLLGAQASQKGFSVAEVPLMTGLNFGGGSEFAVIKLWTSPPHVLLIAAVAVLINSLPLALGAALAPSFQHPPHRVGLPAFFDSESAGVGKG